MMSGGTSLKEATWETKIEVGGLVLKLVLENATSDLVKNAKIQHC
jgi:hypothetical protein